MRKLLLVVGVVADLALAGPALAAGPVWPAASTVSMPAGNQATTADWDPGLSAVACTSAGNCVAGGDYEDANGKDDNQAMLESESDGTWAQATEVTLPAGAKTSAGGEVAAIESVACPTAGSCVAVGHYSDSSGNRQAMLVTEAGGDWGAATEVELPAGADTSGGAQYASLDAVACPNSGDCVATGYYKDQSGNIYAMVLAESDGVWSAQATEVTLPANATSAASEQKASLDGVACTSAGNCVAGGHYAVGSKDYQPMVATESDGVWGQAAALALPTNASTATADLESSIESISCTGAGDCVGVGYYPSRSGNQMPMIATESSGVWGQPTELNLPSGASTGDGLQAAFLESVACTSTGNCAAGGAYTDTNGSDDFQAMTAVESDGVWGQAAELAMPTGANTTPGKQYAGVGSLACPSAGVCVAVGYYKDDNSLSQAFVDTSLSSTAVDSLKVSPALIKIGNIKFNGKKKLTARLTCRGEYGQVCKGKLSLTTVEHFLRGKLVALTAAVKSTKPKRTVRTVQLGTVGYHITASRGETVVIRLGAASRRLLSARGRLSTKLAATPAGSRSAKATELVVLKLKRAKPKRR